MNAETEKQTTRLHALMDAYTDNESSAQCLAKGKQIVAQGKVCLPLLTGKEHALLAGTLQAAQVVIGELEAQVKAAAK